MQRRYNMERSDNALSTGRISYACSGDGTVAVTTGFPVTSAVLSFASLPLDNPTPSNPRIYVDSYNDTGFVVAYEDVPVDPGYIEFMYACE